MVVSLSVGGEVRARPITGKSRLRDCGVRRRGRSTNDAVDKFVNTHAMKERLEPICGSGNVFRDFGDPNADLEQARAILAAKIIDVLDRRKLSVRDAQKLTGVAASEFSRIRNVKLDRFTIDRMITILGKLGQDVQLTIRVQPRRKRSANEARHVA
jgi:predicted XRE-type DNA-binding protein